MAAWTRFRPRLLDSFDGYDGPRFGTDLVAGVTVGVLALPLAMAFAIASGMSPAAGIVTAIVAGLVISVLGGSRVQIGGPTGAFIVIVYGIVVQYGAANLLICTMMAGAMLLAMGLARLGTWIRFIPISVISGFTKGIAVLILLSQVKEFLGLEIEALPAEFFGKVEALWAGLPTTNPQSVALGIACVLLIVLWPGRWRSVPSPVVALVAGTVAAATLGLDVETIGSRFGGIPSGLPAFALPSVSFAELGPLFAPAFAIALLGAIESLLSATVADNMIDDRHDPNQELVAQGLANMAAPLFGGFCATGAIARTSTNVRMGGRTPVAGIVHALTLLAVVLVAAPAARYIPLTVLSAILIVVAWNMGEWGEFRELRRYRFNYQAVLLATFALTVIFDLTVAVQAGLVLAAIFFITRMSGLTRVRELALPDGLAAAGTDAAADTRPVRIFEVFGSLFFGAANKIEPLLTLAEPAHPARVVVLDMQKLINVDTTGLDMLATLQRKLARSGKQLFIAGANAQPLSLFSRSGFLDVLGRDNLCSTVDEALARVGYAQDRQA
ncbi:MAG: STAS domain-containing protein [Rhodocyclaceae bacterium]|jgi:SulP family sulfate permease|nr:STAS domain-containing protein [Rhodocyclaceae bacterium]MCE2981515.1 STAS domain-containing protein [Betaproteobacteria bacterium]MCA3074034.1 STAS domain-containing protein [Rhodocyclaceae bacterium]MCA3090666.1 STAS domain-containing protein [Rhodocyclaceae bacterium]MCA3094892.1 STAS domain-containing protein [Rhodocyclaceae bacterium]